MKPINLFSLTQAQDSLEVSCYEKFLNHYKIEIKSEEVADIKVLVNLLDDNESNKNIFNEFYVSYKIPQIGKEFDLLRFGVNYVLNIELKSSSTEEKIKKQLLRNKYYLSYLGKQIYNFTFESSSQKIFYLNTEDNLEVADSSFLNNLLVGQELIKINKLDDMFNPSDYLVSPFNSTDSFLEDKYFLTNHQELIKKQIIQSVTKSRTENFISVTGSAGTGKTLLVYDIVKEISKTKKALIVHCGNLNAGQVKLKTFGLDIVPIKNLRHCKLSDYDVLIIDEAQRIKAKQLNLIITEISKAKGSCIFSYDKLQTLSFSEKNRNIDKTISSISSITTHKLSEKIRTNKEISTFIKAFFDLKRNIQVVSKDNINLNYFNSIEDTKNYLATVSEDWKFLRFTASMFNLEYHEKYSEIAFQNSHEVIGQEFDNVVVVIDENFTYNNEGKLIYKAKSYYHPVYMLFQNITRTRKRLNIVIINNQEILERCLQLL